MPTILEQPIQRFLDSLRTKGTSYSYRTGIVAFIDFLYGRQRKGIGATQDEFKKYESLGQQYLTSQRDYTADVIKFLKRWETTRSPQIPSHTANGDIMSCSSRLNVINNTQGE